MHILAISGDATLQGRIGSTLAEAGYRDVTQTTSIEAGLAALGIDTATPPRADYRLVLVDVAIGGGQGPRLVSQIRKDARYAEIPIVAIADTREADLLGHAFLAGASDSIAKPVERRDLVARVHSGLRLQSEIQLRGGYERELSRVKAELQRLSEDMDRSRDFDILTQLPTRFALERFLNWHWTHHGKKKPLTLMLAEPDSFNHFCTYYSEEECADLLVMIGRKLSRVDMPLGHMLARYRDHILAVLMPNTTVEEAEDMAGRCREAVREMAIPNAYSSTDEIVTMSCGIASVMPSDILHPYDLVNAASEGLQKARSGGGNLTRVQDIVHPVGEPDARQDELAGG